MTSVRHPATTTTLDPMTPVRRPTTTTTLDPMTSVRRPTATSSVPMTSVRRPTVSALRTAPAAGPVPGRRPANRRTPRSVRRIGAVAAVAAAAALSLPAVAAADSLVYIDGGNVWSSTPDGGHKVRLTEGGGWHSPTQSDDGTIAAVQGTGGIQVMARDGRPIRTITTPTARTGNGGTFAGRPVDLSFSPDGTKIAYSYVALSCPPASTCTDQQSTFYTRADATEATPHSVWGNQFSTSNPEWITNDRVLVSNGNRVSIDVLDAGDYNYVDWIVPGKDIDDAELSRDGRRLATTFFYGAEKIIAFFVVAGDPRTQLPPAQPTAVCNTSESIDLADPSWSPDGSAIAFADKDGINVFRFSRFDVEGCATSGPSILSATGSAPDWGPADPPAARYAVSAPSPSVPTTPAPAVPGTSGAPGATAGRGPGAGAAGGAGAALRFTVRAATRAALRKGLTVAVAAPKAGPVKATLSGGGRVLASRSVRATRAGTVTVRLPKLSARRAAALRGRTLVVKVTAGGRTATSRLEVR